MERAKRQELVVREGIGWTRTHSICFARGRSLGKREREEGSEKSGRIGELRIKKRSNESVSSQKKGAENAGIGIPLTETLNSSAVNFCKQKGFLSIKKAAEENARFGSAWWGVRWHFPSRCWKQA